MKTRRSDRLIDMTRYLLERPHTLISLTFFSERYELEERGLSRLFRKKRHVRLSMT